jgi:hypothetical protein
MAGATGTRSTGFSLQIIRAWAAWAAMGWAHVIGFVAGRSIAMVSRLAVAYAIVITGAGAATRAGHVFGTIVALARLAIAAQLRVEIRACRLLRAGLHEGRLCVG